MSKQKRFTKRFEIEAEIGKLNRRAKAKLKEALELDLKVDSYVDEARAPGALPGNRVFFTEQADLVRKKAIKLRRTVEIINDEKIPALGRTLAAFQTNTLFPGDDVGVVLQK